MSITGTRLSPRRTTDTFQVKKDSKYLQSGHFMADQYCRFAKRNLNMSQKLKRLVFQKLTHSFSYVELPTGHKLKGCCLKRQYFALLGFFLPPVSLSAMDLWTDSRLIKMYPKFMISNQKKSRFVYCYHNEGSRARTKEKPHAHLDLWPHLRSVEFRDLVKALMRYNDKS